MKIKDVTSTALFAAIICVFSPWGIPIGPVSITLATFAVYVVSSIIDWKHGSLAVIIYVLIGCVGVPVFSGFLGGFHIIAGVTGGYIIGYIPCAVITGLIVDMHPTAKWVYPVGMILGTVPCYLVGTLWYAFQTQNSFCAALIVCVVPFLIIDAIKISVASVLSYLLRKRLAVRRTNQK